MTHTHLGKILAVAAAMAATAFLFFSITPANANPSSFLRKQSAAATTTLTYMTPGAATTTLAFDTSAGNTFAPSGTTALLIQLTASSTITDLRWRYEYSQDVACGTTGGNADWYAGDAGFDVNLTATTSPVRYTSGAFDYAWTFSSSTPGAGNAVATLNLGKKIVLVPTPTRCVRAVFFLPIGSTNGAVYAEWLAKKEVQ